MDKEYVYKHAEAAKKAGIVKSTSKRWLKDGLLDVPGVFKRIRNERNKTNDVCFSEYGVRYLKFLKAFSGKDKDNAFYIRIIIAAIKEGRLDKKKIGWPMK